MNLVYYPNNFLERQVSEVDLEKLTFDPIELKKEMVDLMYSKNGVGLAANQIGMDAQIFVVGDKKTEALIINPRVLQHTSDTYQDIEGCLSFPGIFVNVKRPKEILVEYWDENLERKLHKLEGHAARCYLHEWDHLQGITFKDRVSKLKWNMATQKAKKQDRHNAKTS